MSDPLDASVIDSDKVAPVWAEDKDVKNCVGCDAKFTMMKRKHHCRACGRIFCDNCSPHRDELPETFDLKGPQRTCDACHLNLERLRLDDPDSTDSKPDHQAVHSELLEKLKGLVSEPEAHWSSKINKKGVKLDVKKQKDSALVVVRCTMMVKASYEKVITIYTDKELWQQWQPDMLKCKTFETIDAKAEYLYVLYKVPVLDNRDVVIYSAWCNGTVLDPSQKRTKSLVSTSVAHPLMKKVKNAVRAKINIGLTMFQEVDGGCQITSYYHTDPRGIIPPKIVNMTIGKSVDQMIDMIKFMETSDVPVPDVLPGDEEAEEPAAKGPQVALV